MIIATLVKKLFQAAENFVRITLAARHFHYLHLDENCICVAASELIMRHKICDFQHLSIYKNIHNHSYITYLCIVQFIDTLLPGTNLLYQPTPILIFLLS